MNVRICLIEALLCLNMEREPMTFYASDTNRAFKTLTMCHQNSLGNVWFSLLSLPSLPVMFGYQNSAKNVQHAHWTGNSWKFCAFYCTVEPKLWAKSILIERWAKFLDNGYKDPIPPLCLWLIFFLPPWLTIHSFPELTLLACLLTCMLFLIFPSVRQFMSKTHLCFNP